VVASVIMTFSSIVVCLEDRIRSIKKEWYLVHSVTNICVPITLVIF
jgi:hypothetical protein